MERLSSRLRMLVERFERDDEDYGYRGATVSSQTRVKVFELILDPHEGWVADLGDEEIYDVDQGAIEQWPVDEKAIHDALENENVPEAKIKRMLDGKLGKRIKLPGSDGIVIHVDHREPKHPDDPAWRRDWPPDSMRYARRRR